MPTPTYTLIDSVTLTSSASEVTFSSIPAGGDLVLSISHSTNLNIAFKGYLNGDTGANYNLVRMVGDGSTATSSSSSSTSAPIFGSASPIIGNTIIQLMDYSATDKHKSILMRTGSLDEFGSVSAYALRWANTSAVTSIQIDAGSRTFNAGSTFFLYSIAKAL
jgi:hypothetical protein